MVWFFHVIINAAIQWVGWTSSKLGLQVIWLQIKWNGNENENVKIDHPGDLQSNCLYF